MNKITKFKNKDRRDFCFDTFFYVLRSIVGNDVTKEITERYTDVINDHDKRELKKKKDRKWTY